MIKRISSGHWLYIAFAATILLGAFLLFQIQPIVSRQILPWYGGSPAVWTTSLLFFQTLLFAGYLYAHVSARHMSPLWQRRIHLVLLVAAASSLLFIDIQHWKPTNDSFPALTILGILAIAIGSPYFVLSTTGPLLQAWLGRTNPGRSPYRLYSLSNLSSLLALVSYPVLIEPHLSLGVQTNVWHVAFFVFATLYAFLTVCMTRADAGAALEFSDRSDSTLMGHDGSDGSQTATAADHGPPTIQRRLTWLALPAFASLALLATTNHMCQDVAAIPLLWVVPLALYLLSFVICFEHERWHRPRLTACITLLIIAAGIWYSVSAYAPGQGNQQNIFVTLAIDCGGLFGLCMLCHGELVRLKPSPRHLTTFYLYISAGGALGGVVVSLLAPCILPGFGEWYLVVFGGCLLAIGVLCGIHADERLLQRLSLVAPGLLIVGSAMAYLATWDFFTNHGVLDIRRNIFGVLTVVKAPQRAGVDYHWCNFLLNGGVRHGQQFTDDELRRSPISYFSASSGVGRAMTDLSSAGKIRVGVIGLGVGTLAAYARADDDYVFYELNPDVQFMAERYFTYLSDARDRMKSGKGTVKVVIGDGRLSLERELNAQTSAARFDILVVDAFSGDAIPMHLLTREAAASYSRLLQPGGVLAIQMSNSYVDLVPVARGLAQSLDLTPLEIEAAGNLSAGTYYSDWMLLTRNQELIARLKPFAKPTSPDAPTILWTDDFSNLFRILR